MYMKNLDRILSFTGQSRESRQCYPIELSAVTKMDIF